MQSCRRKQRMREISIEKIYDIKDTLCLGWEEIEKFLGIGTVQRRRYETSGGVPADRYYGFQQALLLEAEQEAREKREMIIKLFG